MTTEIEQSKIGETLIEVLGLRVKSNGRVNTTWGDKTPLGLYLTVQRIIDEARESKS
jgi:hypothetical protein